MHPLIILILFIIICGMGIFRHIQKQQPVFYSTKEYPQLKPLEKHWKTILSEIPEFNKDDSRIFMRDRYAWNNESGETLIDKINKHKYWVKGWWSDVEWYQYPLLYHGNPVGGAVEQCPKTIAILQSIPGLMIVGYALLLPHTKLPVHQDEAGSKNGSMACNMGLTRNRATLCVENDHGEMQKKSIKPGEMVIFDSTRNHTASNDDPKPRYILYLQFQME